MNTVKSAFFKLAHKAAKKVHVKGESYQVTFGAALKNILKISRGTKKMVAPIIAQGITHITFDATKKGNCVFLNSETQRMNLTDFLTKGRSISTYYVTADDKCKSDTMRVVLITVHTMIQAAK